MEDKMITRYSILEQPIPGISVTEERGNSLIALPGRIVFNCRRWLRNRRELRNLDNDQLRDVGLSREAVEQACRLNLLRR
jgi:uncharacterized protein YjiS (DUF1127 family)